jgi:rhodanese-related sulfurtransferase
MGRIEGSLLIPLRELPRKIDELDADRPLVVYCHLGMRSLHAVQLLRSRGFRGAVSLRGGIDAWNREAAAGARR